MNKSPSADTRILSVSIVAGPSAGALLQRIGAINDTRRLILPAAAVSPDGHQVLGQISTIAEQGEVDHLVIECDPQVPPIAYASLFLSPPLLETARLSRAALVIRPSHLLGSLVRRNDEAQLGSPCFLAEQLEFVTHILLDGDKEDPEFKLARKLALTLNPPAAVSDLSSEIVESLLDNTETASFDLTAALDEAGWRQLIDAEKPSDGIENEITSFAYRARRPFHPERFWALLQNGLPGIFRAKGFFWLATRMDLVGGLNLAGPELHCAAAGQWWAARDEHARQHEMPERTRKEWKEPFGDRRQAIAFMGFDYDPDVFKAHLDACLLTDSEMAAGPENWLSFADPFPSWSVHVHTHECDHAHDSAHHDCCHH